MSDEATTTDGTPPTMSLKERIALLNSTPKSSPPTSGPPSGPPSRSKSVYSTTNNVTEKLASLKASLNADADTSMDPSITPAKDARPKSMPFNTPKDSAISSKSTIADRIAALKTTTPIQLTTPPPTTANSSESQTSHSDHRKGSIADRIAALKGEPGGASVGNPGSSKQASPAEASTTVFSKCDESASNAVEDSSKANDAKIIASKFNNKGFNPFAPRPKVKSAEGNAVEVAVDDAKAEKSKSGAEIVHV